MFGRGPRRPRPRCRARARGHPAATLRRRPSRRPRPANWPTGRPLKRSLLAPASETDLVGRWQAANGSDTVELEITADSTFTWKARPKDGPAVELSGTVETAADAIKLESEKAGTMVGKVALQGPDAFEFSLPGAPADVKPLRFERQKP